MTIQNFGGRFQAKLEVVPGLVPEQLKVLQQIS